MQTEMITATLHACVQRPLKQARGVSTCGWFQRCLEHSIGQISIASFYLGSAHVVMPCPLANRLQAAVPTCEGVCVLPLLLPLCVLTAMPPLPLRPSHASACPPFVAS